MEGREKELRKKKKKKGKRKGRNPKNSFQSWRLFLHNIYCNYKVAASWVPLKVTAICCVGGVVVSL
jgi:hypothetical protein